jgi:hypothetical protein
VALFKQSRALERRTGRTVARGGSAPLAELTAEMLGWVESVALVTHAQTAPQSTVSRLG